MRLTALLLAVATCGVATADPVKQAPRVLKPADAGVGQLVPDAAFADLAGKAGKLSDFKAHKFLVVAFTNTTCPLCKKYGPSLARLEKECAAKGVAFLFVNPTATDDVKESPFAGRYVHDKSGALTAALGAKSTTEVVVLDAARTVVYRGAIDDQYGLGYALDAPRFTYLSAALNDLLAGKVPVIAATTAPGCELDTAPAAKTPLTYHARAERIIQANCVTCHRAGGVGPFALVKYEDVIAHRGAIQRVVDAGTMPPWTAAPPPKGERTPWVNDCSLTASDKADLLAWLAGDRKKGDPADAPLPRSFETGWAIGKPDAVFQLPRDVTVKAEGVMPYQNLVVDTTFDEDKWVRAIEVQPTARQVVHHILVFVVPKGSRKPAEGDGFFACYVPGNNLLVYPDGYAKKLPKGTSLLFQMHYTPNGKAATDRTRIGLTFAAAPPRHEVHTSSLVNAGFLIPPNATDFKIEAKMAALPFDAKVLAFFPHAHVRGKAVRYEVTRPGEKPAVLLDVPRYDFNWQFVYRYAESQPLPKGTSMTYTGWYDNSAANPANPDPSAFVKWGPQTNEEMHLGYLEFVFDMPPVVIPKGGVEIPAAYKALFRTHDKNRDGKLDEQEIDALPAVVKGAVLDYILRQK